MIEKTLKRLTEALNEAEDAEFEMLKQEVSNLTDENEHTQAVLVIADYYNLTYYVQKFKEIKDYQDSPQYQGLTLEQSKERFKERVAISVALISPMERSIISCKSSDKLVYFFIERISFFEGVLYFFSAGGAFFF